VITKRLVRNHLLNLLVVNHTIAVGQAVGEDEQDYDDQDLRGADAEMQSRHLENVLASKHGAQKSVPNITMQNRMKHGAQKSRKHLGNLTANAEPNDTRARRDSLDSMRGLRDVTFGHGKTEPAHEKKTATENPLAVQQGGRKLSSQIAHVVAI
jgi:hypothetical protein